MVFCYKNNSKLIQLGNSFPDSCQGLASSFNDSCSSYQLTFSIQPLPFTCNHDLLHTTPLFLFFKFLKICVLILEQEEGGKKREKHQLAGAIHAPIRYGTHNPGMCPDQETNPQPSDVWGKAPTNWDTLARASPSLSHATLGTSRVGILTALCYHQPQGLLLLVASSQPYSHLCNNFCIKLFSTT